MATKCKTPAWVKARADMAEATSLDPFEAVEVPVHMAARKPATRKSKKAKAADSVTVEAKPGVIAGAAAGTCEAGAEIPSPEIKEGRPTKYKPEFAAIAKALTGCDRRGFGRGI